MSPMTLYHAEGACSSVTLTTLRHAGLPHHVVPVDLAAGEQRGAAFLAINPMGKVPALLVEGTLLTENPAILLYLDALRPGAGLLPHPTDPVARAAAVGDLVWCGATLHPLARAIYMPSRLTDGDGAGVRAKALALMVPIADRCEARLSRQPHWFGEIRSIIDDYLAWIFALARRGGLSLEARPALARLADRTAAGV